MADPLVVEHEILGQLKRAGLVIVSKGSDAEVYTPIDKFIIGTATLHYGTLVYLLNRDSSNPDSTKTGPMQWTAIQKKKGDITIRQFGWEDIADAIQTLAFNKDVIDNAEDSLNIEERIIKLTHQGLAAYNRETYFKEARADQRADELQQYTAQSANYTKQLTASTVNTNKWLTRMAILGGLFTFLIAVTGVFQYFKADETKVKGWDLLIRKIDTALKANGKIGPVAMTDTTVRLLSVPRHAKRHASSPNARWQRPRESGERAIEP